MDLLWTNIPPEVSFRRVFATQAYRGAQNPSPVELLYTQATQMAKNPATVKSSKMDITVTEGETQLPRTHNLKPHDLNVLTHTSF